MSLALCALGFWGISLHAQDGNASTIAPQPEQTIPLSLEIQLEKDFDISTPLTISLSINWTHTLTDVTLDAPSPVIMLQFKPVITAVSPGVTITVDSAQSMKVFVPLSEVEDTTVVTDSQIFVGIVKRDANLRLGPGTNYAVDGQLLLGEPIRVVASNEAGDWYQLEDGKWIAAFLVDGLPDDLSALNNTTSQLQEPGTTPAGWARYSLISSGVSFAAPPEWEVEQENTDSISFVPSDGSFKMLDVMFVDGTDPITDNEQELIRLLKLTVIQAMDNFNIVYLREGGLEVAGKPVYVVGKASSKEGSGDAAFANIALVSGTGAILIRYLAADSDDVSDETLDSLAQIINSVITPNKGRVTNDE